MKRVLAMLLCICMLLSIAACGAPAKKTAQKQPETSQSQPSQAEKPKEEKSEALSREDKELVAELIGGKENASPCCRSLICFLFSAFLLESS